MEEGPPLAAHAPQEMWCRPGLTPWQGWQARGHAERRALPWPRWGLSVLDPPHPSGSRVPGDRQRGSLELRELTSGKLDVPGPPARLQLRARWGLAGVQSPDAPRGDAGAEGAARGHAWGCQLQQGGFKMGLSSRLCPSGLSWAGPPQVQSCPHSWIRLPGGRQGPVESGVTPLWGSQRGQH